MERMLLVSRNAVFGLLVLGLAACSSGRQARSVARPAPTLYEWNAEGLSGQTRIVIDLTEQRADVTIGGQPAGWAVVATGKEGHDTPAGDYKVIEKVADKYSNLYGVTVDADGNIVNDSADVRKHSPPPGGEFKFAPMPYWLRLTNYGIGLHAGHIPQPGEPASHGCIRMPGEFAPQLFDVVEVGTPVTIVR